MEIQKTNFEIGGVGRDFLDNLRKAWTIETKEREKTKLVDGVPTIVKETIKTPSPIRLLNQGVHAKKFYQFAELMKPEDEQRISKTIEAGVFEVEKALTAFNALNDAFDRSIKISTWQDAEKANTASLATLAKYKGEEKTVSVVYLMLKKLASKFGRRMDLEADGFDLLKELSEDIVSDCKSFSIADLRLVFKTLQNGQKKVFNLDYQTVMAALEDAKVEKMEYASQKAMKEHSRITGQEKTNRYRSDDKGYEGKKFDPEEVQKAIDDFKKHS